MGKLAAAIDILISANSARVKTDTDKISAIIGSASNDWKAKVEASGRTMSNMFSKAGLDADGLAKRVGKIGLGMVGLGAGVGVGVFVGKINTAIEAAAKLQEMSEKTGASVENLSAMTFVAKIAGTDLDAMAGGMVKLAKNMEASGGPSKDMGDALNRIGLSVKDLKGLDPAEMMKKVADAMSNYGDSAGKTAVAVTLFGKSGAEMLPVLKELGEGGSLIAKTTTEQAHAAEVLEKNLVRLKLTKEAMYKAIAMEVTPALAMFTGALVESKKESDNLQKKLKGLATDGGLAEFAENAVSAAAIIIDAFRGIAGIVQGAGMAIGATAAAIATRSTVPFKEFSADWDKLEKQINGSSLFAKLQEMREKGLGKQKVRPVVGGGNEGVVNDNSGKEAQTFLKSLQERVNKTSEAEYGALRLKAANLGVADAAKKWIDQIVQADFGRAIDKFTNGLDVANKKAELQISLIGRTKLEQDVANATYDNEIAKQNLRLDLQQKFGKELSEERWNEAASKADVALNRQIELIKKRDEAEKDAVLGISSAGNKYVEESEKIGKSMESAFGNAFRGIEDGLVSLATNGTASFQQFATAVLNDLSRMMVRAMIVGPIMKALGFGGQQSAGPIPPNEFVGPLTANGKQANGGGWNAGVQFFASGGVFNGPTAFKHSGGLGVLGEAGPEAVMPLMRAADGKLGVRAAGGGGSNVTVIVNNNADGTKATTSETTDSFGNRQIEVMIASAVNKAIASGKTDNAMRASYGVRRVAG